jgi:hypothetical protein
MVRGPGASCTSNEHTTDHCSRHILYMARGHIPSPHLHLTIPSNGWGMGTNRHSGQVQSPPVKQNVHTRRLSWYHHGRVATQLRSKRKNSHSTKYHCLSHRNGARASLCTRYAICTDPRIERVTQNMAQTHILGIAHRVHYSIFGTTPRIMTMYPNNNWTRIWPNMHTAWVPSTVRSTWYMVFNDILPNKKRLKRIAIADSDHCNQCGQSDTL